MDQVTAQALSLFDKIMDLRMTSLPTQGAKVTGARPPTMPALSTTSRVNE
jgi:hypothetical protein